MKLSKFDGRKSKTSKQKFDTRNMLETINLSKTYISDGVGYDALKNINLQIEQGECAAIIGKSGSGKSTLMHLLACLDLPTTGSVSFEGEEYTLLS